MYSCGMKGDKNKKKPLLESVKIEQEVVDMVRENKKKNYVPIGEFFKLAALEKLKKEIK